MYCITLLSLLGLTLGLTLGLNDENEYYSFSQAVGTGGGTAYSLTGDGRITGVRMWDWDNYVYGIQFRYGDIWSEIVGSTSSYKQELELYDDEAIIQIHGIYGSYVRELVFVTNMGRSIYAGGPSGNSFNMVPDHQGAELRFISGTSNGRITAISAHWGLVHQDTEEDF